MQLDFLVMNSTGNFRMYLSSYEMPPLSGRHPIMC